VLCVCVCVCVYLLFLGEGWISDKEEFLANRVECLMKLHEAAQRFIEGSFIGIVMAKQNYAPLLAKGQKVRALLLCRHSRSLARCLCCLCICFCQHFFLFS
jgi:hypothetical protein